MSCVHRFHTASPVSFGTGNAAEDQKGIIDVAVNGQSPQCTSVKLFNVCMR